MNGISNKEDKKCGERHKKLAVINLSISCTLLISFIIALIVITDNSKSYVKRIYDKSLQSVVEVKAYTRDVGESFGSAVLMKSDGTLVTNAHVVTYSKLGETKAVDEISIRFANSDNYMSVALVKYDVLKDLAVLKIKDKNNKNLKAIKTGDIKKVKSGDEVFAIGNLSNYGIGITKGYVSVPKINIIVDGNKKEAIQCDITIVSGSSGGALVNRNGKLIGITTFRTKDNLGNVIHGIGYVIPINRVLEYIK